MLCRSASLTCHLGTEAGASHTFRILDALQRRVSFIGLIFIAAIGRYQSRSRRRGPRCGDTMPYVPRRGEQLRQTVARCGWSGTENSHYTPRKQRRDRGPPQRRGRSPPPLRLPWKGGSPPQPLEVWHLRQSGRTSPPVATLCTTSQDAANRRGKQMRGVATQCNAFQNAAYRRCRQLRDVAMLCNTSKPRRAVGL